MSVKEIAGLLNVGEATVRRWIHDGDLPAVAVGREWRIVPKEPEAFLEKGSTQRQSAGLCDGRTEPHL